MTKNNKMKYFLLNKPRTKSNSESIKPINKLQDLIKKLLIQSNAKIKKVTIRFNLRYKIIISQANLK